MKIRNYEYGCENKLYWIAFYKNRNELEEKTGLIKTVKGTVENFQPNGQTAIRDENGDFWLIESKLISTMIPV